MATNTHPGKPLAAYTRVSSQGDRDDQELHSHELQRARIEAGATVFGYALSPERFEDTNASGGSMDRPAFNRVMEGIRSGEYGGVVIAKLSRFARTTTGGLKAIMEIEAAGGTFVCLDPPIDTKSSTGRFVLTVFLGLYAMEREATGEVAHAVKDLKIEEGIHQATVAPAGYEYEVVGWNAKKQRAIRGKLVPTEHAPAVVKAFELRAAGGTWEQVAALLVERGVPSRNGAWSTTGVRSLIENEVYLGTALSGARRKEGAHEAVVGRALFAAANARTGTRAVTWAGSDGPLLGGLIKCGSCGHAMSRDWTFRKNQDGTHGKKYASYKCKANLKCERHASISALQVEPYVLDAALGVLGAVGYQARGPAENVDVTSWEAQLDALRAEEAELDATHAAGEFSATAYAKAQTALERRRAEIEGARPRGRAGELYTLLLSETGVRDAFAAMTVPDRRKALGWLVDRVVVAPGRGTAEDRVVVALTDFDPAAHGLVATKVTPLPIDRDADGERFEVAA